MGALCERLGVMPPPELLGERVCMSDAVMPRIAEDARSFCAEYARMRESMRENDVVFGEGEAEAALHVPAREPARVSTVGALGEPREEGEAEAALHEPARERIPHARTTSGERTARTTSGERTPAGVSGERVTTAVSRREEGEAHQRVGDAALHVPARERIFRGEGEAEAARLETTRPDLARLFQRRLAGHARAMLFVVSDYISMFCMEDERGYYTEKVKREVFKLNEAMRPWAILLGRITTHKRLTQVADLCTQSSMEGGRPISKPVVYARVNTETGDMYIGETKAWESRVKQHFVATSKHRHDAPRPCKGCAEHAKYKRHRAVAPGAWITVPVMEVNEKYEAKRSERKVIRMLKPNLNAVDRPFWLLKETYVAVYKSTRRKKEGEKPWRSDSAPPRGRDELPFFTFYKFEGEQHVDMGAVLARMSQTGKAAWVTVTPGKHDLTRWARVRKRYGGSKLKTFGEEAFDGILHDWRKEKGTEAQIYIRAHVTEKPERQVWKDIDAFRERLASADDEEIAFYWRVRKDKGVLEDTYPKFKARTMILDECEQRFEGFTRKPITLRLPYFKELMAHKVKEAVQKLIDARPWPQYLIDWHKNNVKFITESQPSIEDIMCNVTKPWRPTGCKCCEIKRSLEKKDPTVKLPEIDGHLFFISRDYHGPHASALGVSGNNIPSQTYWDITKAWSKIAKQLPEGMRLPEKEWEAKLKGCTQQRAKERQRFTTTKDVYTLRKELNGLVCGQIDKNLHELWFCCPCLYERAWGKMYGEQTGYERVYARKDTPRRRQSMRNILSTETLPARSTGNESDVVKAWGKLYRSKQWHRYAQYNRKGGFCVPYILFKAKNITDPSVRAQKWAKARPIAPATRHPMKSLFGLTGRAWSYITSRLESSNFVIQHGGQVTNFMREAEEKLGGKGQLKVVVKDIEGCFSNMPKEAIRLALRTELQKIEKASGYDAISIPRSRKRPCSFKPIKGSKRIPFQDLLDIMDFALDNTVMRAFDGNLWRQRDGIPMGDPHSPGMCIGGCAWMEAEWLKGLDEETKSNFLARRYMDDVLCFYAQHDNWNEEAFLKGIGEECYFPPLKLEDGGDGTFLETSFHITKANRVRHWLKNQNAPGREPKVWRYAHFKSHAPFQQKRSVMMACLKKVHSMASDPHVLRGSAVQKLAEFARLQYPRRLLWSACTTMGVHTRNPAWFRARDEIPSV